MIIKQLRRLLGVVLLTVLNNRRTCRGGGAEAGAQPSASSIRPAHTYVRTDCAPCTVGKCSCPSQSLMAATSALLSLPGDVLGQQAEQPHACAWCLQGANFAMGKARKRSRLSRHCTGYPYNPVRVSAAHADNNSLRGHDMSGLFAGEGRCLRSADFEQSLRCCLMGISRATRPCPCYLAHLTLCSSKGTQQF